MTLLLFRQTATEVFIVTDTLVSDQERKPVMFQTKVFPIPHLNVVIALTGHCNLGELWFVRVSKYEGVTDIDGVNSVAQVELKHIWEALREFHAPEDIGTSTVYLFGYPDGSDQLVRYIYRSGDDFTPERVEGAECFAAKPPPQNFPLVDPEGVDEIIALATAIKEENDELRTPGPVGIGGDLFLTSLRRDLIVTRRIHRFPDYDTQLAQMAS